MASPKLSSTNARLAAGLGVLACAAFGFAYLQPPLYRAFCEWTGINDVQKADDFQASSVAGRPVTIEFDANTHGQGLRFISLHNAVQARTGELVQVSFRVQNTSDRPITGQAVPSYGPRHAANFVKKLECFCFRQQTFAPGEVRDMPVVFALDRQLPDDVVTVTLSYTFFEVPGTSADAAAAAKPLSGPAKGT
ncbi:cytochrome c oxidase assembly protein [Ideonella alba]|uniref:cytochrome c oxidase assembly protein n=1 Tax=Ideonella alba TaxID=2824118 RepID=UPI002872B0E6|nr:cytochrome c oxidase assembly protein [Ideonella alba]